MSYDVTVGAGETFNMTYNVSPVFYDHMNSRDAATESGRDVGGINLLHGLTGREAAAELGVFFKRANETRHKLWSHGVRGEPAMCEKYDAQNGWGSLVGALIFAGEILAACAADPDGIVTVS